MQILNGKITNEETVQLDRGFFFGYGLFETIRVKNAQPILLKEHLDRLNAGLVILKIKKIVNEKEIRDQIKHFQQKDYALKIAVSDENILLSIRDIIYKQEDYDQGMSLYISTMRRNPSAYTTYLKSLNYADNIIEKQNALDLGYNEALMMNNEGFITECSMTNIFFIEDEQVYTPSIDCGLLNGIVRTWVINNYTVIDGEFSLDRLLNSDGIFITNSLMGIMKIFKVGDKQIKYSPIIEKIQREYNRFLEVSSYESKN